MASASNNYRVNVVRHDGVLRMLVPSRRRGVLPYLVQLDSYGGNGMCICKDFAIHKEPLLRRGVTPEAAVDGELVKVPAWGTVEDSLRCFHIHVARMKFVDDVIQEIAKNQPRAHDR